MARRPAESRRASPGVRLWSLGAAVAAWGAEAQQPDQIRTLPGLPPDVDVGVQFAGYVPVTGPYGEPTVSGEEEEIFYWFVGRKGADVEKQPTILWSSGGPGASSFWGFFTENGPYTVERRGPGPADTVLVPRPNAWSDHANYLIFEHPLGVTLSFPRDERDLPHNVTIGIKGLAQALLYFIERHPFVAKNPVMLAGESYAGTYLPLLAKELKDIERRTGSKILDLSALALISPWVNPEVQMETTTEYSAVHGLITWDEKRILDQQYSFAKGNLDKVKDVIANMTGVYMLNPARSGDPDDKPVMDYLNRPDVRAAVHAKQGPLITELMSTAISDLYNSTLHYSVEVVVQQLLQAEGLPVIVVSGLNDASDCNFIGNARWLERLSGSHARHFKAAPPGQWRDASTSGVLGFIQDGRDASGRGLAWVKVLNAGHMAPLDQPLLLELLLNQTGWHHPAASGSAPGTARPRFLGGLAPFQKSYEMLTE